MPCEGKLSILEPEAAVALFALIQRQELSLFKGEGDVPLLGHVSFLNSWLHEEHWLQSKTIVHLCPHQGEQ